MNSRAYSIIEVILAAAIVAVGLTAAAVLASTLMRNQEINAAAVRAANLQEQAVALYRLGLPTNTVSFLLPSSEYAFEFGSPESTNLVASDGSLVSVEVVICTMRSINASESGLSAISNTVTVVRPTIRAD